MIEPSKQIEIQLGHLCNNRCVFCVSGQMSERKMAGQVPVDPVIAELRAAHEKGFERVTFLGGEPTIQRSFMDAIRTATELGFPEIVIFTNGVMASKPRFLERVLEVGDFTWRFSIQGATASHHDAVTKNEGSFDRIIKAIKMLRERGQRVTANMCVTTENLASLPVYPSLVAELDVHQLHLDMVRPLDAGDRTDDYLESILPRYTDMREPMIEMLDGFDPDFDVNIGNFPYCMLPEHIHRIHHDGQWTMTVAADGNNQLEPAWDKYEVKRRDKTHPDACDSCVFQSRCNGLFDKYLEIHGSGEPKSIQYHDLLEQDPDRHFFVLLMEQALKRAESWSPPSSGQTLQIHRDEPGRTIRLILNHEADSSSLHLSLRPAGEMTYPDAQSSLFDFRADWGLSTSTDSHVEGLQSLFEILCGDENPVTRKLDAEKMMERGRQERRLLRYGEKLMRFAQSEGLSRPEIMRTDHGIVLMIQLDGDVQVRFEFQLPTGDSGRIGISYSLDTPSPSELHREWMERAIASLRSSQRNAAQTTA